MALLVYFVLSTAAPLITIGLGYSLMSTEAQKARIRATEGLSATA